MIFLFFILKSIFWKLILFQMSVASRNRIENDIDLRDDIDFYDDSDFGVDVDVDLKK